MLPLRDLSVCVSVCSSFTLLHPAKATELNDMPFGRDTHMVLSNVVLDGDPGLPWEGKVWGSDPQFTAMPLVAKLLWPLFVLAVTLLVPQ